MKDHLLELSSIMSTEVAKDHDTWNGIQWQKPKNSMSSLINQHFRETVDLVDLLQQTQQAVYISID